MPNVWSLKIRSFPKAYICPSQADRTYHQMLGFLFSIYTYITYSQVIYRSTWIKVGDISIQTLPDIRRQRELPAAFKNCAVLPKSTARCSECKRGWLCSSSRLGKPGWVCLVFACFFLFAMNSGTYWAAESCYFCRVSKDPKPYY